MRQTGLQKTYHKAVPSATSARHRARGGDPLKDKIAVTERGQVREVPLDSAVAAYDPIKRHDVVNSHQQLISAYSQQQQAAALSVAGVVDAGRHSSTSTADEIAERRRTERMYLLFYYLSAATMIGGAIGVSALLLWQQWSAAQGWLFWMLAFLFAAGFMTTR